ncbi:MAG: hypothetical protein AB7O60_01195 [Variibacter sp.]
MFKKSLVVLSAALVLTSTSAAFAMAGNSDHRAGTRADSSVRQWRQASAASDVVVENGKVIGRDPDANVRLQIRKDYLNLFR